MICWANCNDRGGRKFRNRLLFRKTTLSFFPKKAVSMTIFGQSASFLLPDHFWSNIVASFTFGAVGIVLLLLGYWLFDWITPRIDVQKELTVKNTAVAI